MTDGPSRDQFTFDYTGDGPDDLIISVVRAVAWVKGVDVADLEPLDAAVDSDQLIALFEVGSAGEEITRKADGHGADGAEVTDVTFRYEGCIVTVGPGSIQIVRA